MGERGDEAQRRVRCAQGDLDEVVIRERRVGPAVDAPTQAFEGPVGDERGKGAIGKTRIARGGVGEGGGQDGRVD